MGKKIKWQCPVFDARLFLEKNYICSSNYYECKHREENQKIQRRKRNFPGRTGRKVAYFSLYLSKNRKWGNQLLVNHIENICTSLDVNMEDILKPEEGYVQVNNNNDSSNSPSDNGIGLIQNQTNHYNTPEKLIVQYEERIKELKEQLEYWKSKAEGNK